MRRILVLTNGFVLLSEGAVTLLADGTHYLATGVSVVRRWGTTRGLGELLQGTTPQTVLDPIEGTVVVPVGSVVMVLGGDGCERG